MDAPVNYNGTAQRIAVDPDALVHTGTVTLEGRITQLSDTLKAISNTWETLKLSWLGDSADAAKDFNDKWVKVGNQLFGPEGAELDQTAAGEAVLPKIASAVAMAGGNFAKAEDDVITMMQLIANNTAADEGPGSSERRPDTSRSDVPGTTPSPIDSSNTAKTPGY